MRLLTYDSAESISEYHDTFLNELQRAQDRLYSRLEHTPEFQPDKTVESLRFLGDWFIDRLKANEPDGDMYLPVWWDMAFPPAGTGTPKDARWTPQQLRLIDQVHAYYVDVLQAQRPDAFWISFKGEHRDSRNGSTLLVVGNAEMPVITLNPIFGTAVRLYRLGEQPVPGWLASEASQDITSDAARL
ncbi:hypothetical protein [Salinibacterium sp. ZJ450]|uniref:hypothetical protein n=1 Tax=Salinibacterium sp. ZJ450 TaxID=2708338 RepID=UPI0014202229|nr:hypothetical protein [Salinibacterium sp. ZJ450]